MGSSTGSSTDCAASMESGARSSSISKRDNEDDEDDADEHEEQQAEELQEVGVALAAEDALSSQNLVSYRAAWTS